MFKWHVVFILENPILITMCWNKTFDLKYCKRYISGPWFMFFYLCVIHLCQISKQSPNIWFMQISMTTLMEHSSAQPRECSFLPKKLISTNIFFVELVFGCAWYDKNRALFRKKVFQKWTNGNNENCSTDPIFRTENYFQIKSLCLGGNYHGHKMRALRWAWKLAQINNPHARQLKISKSWEPFWS